MGFASLIKKESNLSRLMVPFHLKGLVFLALSAAMLCVLLCLDRFWFHRGILSERPPIMDITHLLRSFAVVCAAVLTLVGLRVLVRPCDVDAPPAVAPWPRTACGLWLACGIPLSVAVFMTPLMVLNPELFYGLVREDGLVEMLSAVLAFCAGLCLLRVWQVSRAARRPPDLLAQAFVLLFGIACILLAGEEVSWLQRQIGFDTPESFLGNKQKEFNLHNFETDRVETAYYVWAFGMTVFAAFLREAVPAVRLLPWLPELLPGRVVACAGALATGLNYEMWNTVPTQLIFFMTVGILVWFIVHPRGGVGGRWLPLAVLLLLLAGQVMAIGWGHLAVRSHDSTELKEWFMPFSFLLYALELLARNNKLRETQAGRTAVVTTSLNRP